MATVAMMPVWIPSLLDLLPRVGEPGRVLPHA